jgi:orotate phosphoribosyltransferase
MIPASHLEVCFCPKTLNLVVGRLYSLIKETRLDFDYIAFTGLSGSMVAPILCLKLNKLPIYIRKTTEERHSSNIIEAFQKGPFNYIIIDDFIATGTTIRKILDAITISECGGNCVGIFLYHDDFGTSRTHNVQVYRASCRDLLDFTRHFYSLIEDDNLNRALKLYGLPNSRKYANIGKSNINGEKGASTGLLPSYEDIKSTLCNKKEETPCCRYV